MTGRKETIITVGEREKERERDNVQSSYVNISHAEKALLNLIEIEQEIEVTWRKRILWFGWVVYHG